MSKEEEEKLSLALIKKLQKEDEVNSKGRKKPVNKAGESTGTSKRKKQ